MKNEYESLVYKARDKISNDWKKISSKEEQRNINEMLDEGQQWI